MTDTTEGSDMEQGQEPGIVVSYLPIGSVVKLKDGERPVVVAGCMALDGVTCRLWDYMGYPWPEGRQDATKDYFFDSDMIVEVLQIGFLDRAAIEHQRALAVASGLYQEAKTRQGK